MKKNLKTINFQRDGIFKGIFSERIFSISMTNKIDLFIYVLFSCMFLFAKIRWYLYNDWQNRIILSLYACILTFQNRFSLLGSVQFLKCQHSIKKPKPKMMLTLCLYFCVWPCEKYFVIDRNLATHYTVIT